MFNLAVSYKPDNTVKTGAKNSPSVNLQTASSQRLNLDTRPPPTHPPRAFFSPSSTLPLSQHFSSCHFPSHSPLCLFASLRRVINAVLTSRCRHSLHNSNSPSFQHRLLPLSSFKWPLLPSQIVINGSACANIICMSRVLLLYSSKPIKIIPRRLGMIMITMIMTQVFFPTIKRRPVSHIKSFLLDTHAQTRTLAIPKTVIQLKLQTLIVGSKRLKFSHQTTLSAARTRT